MEWRQTMRRGLAIVVSAIVLASPAFAGTPPVSSSDDVRNAVLDVLGQRGLQPSAAAQIADQVVHRLSEDPAAPHLTEKPGPAVSSDWKDALSAETKGPPALTVESPIAPGAEKAYPENVANLVIEKTEDVGRLVILRHLKGIEASGRMSDRIVTDDYWRDVFKSQGYGDIYDASRDVLKTALRAGLKPYKEGRNLNATEFARLAVQALQPPAAVAEIPGGLVQP